MIQAVKWIKEHARPLEKALYKYHFENGLEEDVIVALGKYQNEDGGFGHGLEPDFLNPNSNPIDCWVASKIIDDIGMSIDHPMVINLVKYLKETPYKNGWMYHYSIPSNNDYPHAPWWHYEAKKDIAGYNPTASLLGFLFNYMDLKDEKHLEVIDQIDKAMSYFINQDLSEMHELKCFNELYDYIYLDMNVKKFEIALKVKNIKTIEKDKSKWFNTYCPKPLQVFSSVHSPGFFEMKSLVDAELIETYQRMHEDGYVDVVWSWLSDHEVFKKSKIAWQGILTLDMLVNLKKYGIKV